MKLRTILTLMFVAVFTWSLAGCGGSQEKSSAMDVNFTVLQATGSIIVEGKVFDDTNGNGIIDTNEVGIEGVTIDLTDNADLVLESTSTDSGGYYAFAVTAGQYKVIETDPVGYLSTTPNDVSFEAIDENLTINFGDQLSTPVYSVFGTVFNDMNDNGFMDSGEMGIAGVTASLVGVEDTVTDLEGGYAFAVTTTGEYSVGITVPEGYILTTPSPVGITVSDSDVQVNFGLMISMDVPVDIKPGSDKNPFNLKSKGVLPIAILGSADVDVTMIDPSTILFNGVAPLRWSIEDVCGPKAPEPMAPDTQPLDASMDGDDDDDMEMPDGYDDLTLKFSRQELAATFDEGVMRGDVVILYLEGSTFDGAAVFGEDAVWVNQILK